jgi:hypothetical protein
MLSPLKTSICPSLVSGMPGNSSSMAPGPASTYLSGLVCRSSWVTLVELQLCGIGEQILPRFHQVEVVGLERVYPSFVKSYTCLPAVSHPRV